MGLGLLKTPGRKTRSVWGRRSMMANKKEGPVDRRMKLPLCRKHFRPIPVHRHGAWIDSCAGGRRGMQGDAGSGFPAPPVLCSFPQAPQGLRDSG